MDSEFSTLKLKPNKIKIAIWLVVFLVITIIFIMIVLSGDHDLRGYAGVVFGIAGSIFFFIPLVTNSLYIDLTPEGFTQKGLLGSSMFKWQDIKGFYSFSLWPASFMGITLNDFFRGSKNRMFLDVYGNMKTEEFVNLLNTWVKKYGNQTPTS